MTTTTILLLVAALAASTVVHATPFIATSVYVLSGADTANCSSTPFVTISIPQDGCATLPQSALYAKLTDNGAGDVSYSLFSAANCSSTALVLSGTIPYGSCSVSFPISDELTVQVTFNPSTGAGAQGQLYADAACTTTLTAFSVGVDTCGTFTLNGTALAQYGGEVKTSSSSATAEAFYGACFAGSNTGDGDSPCTTGNCLGVVAPISKTACSAIDLTLAGLPGVAIYVQITSGAVATLASSFAALFAVVTAMLVLF